MALRVAPQRVPLLRRQRRQRGRNPEQNDAMRGAGVVEAGRGVGGFVRLNALLPEFGQVPAAAAAFSDAISLVAGERDLPVAGPPVGYGALQRGHLVVLLLTRTPAGLRVHEIQRCKCSGGKRFYAPRAAGASEPAEAPQPPVGAVLWLRAHEARVREAEAGGDVGADGVAQRARVRHGDCGPWPVPPVPRVAQRCDDGLRQRSTPLCNAHQVAQARQGVREHAVEKGAGGERRSAPVRRRCLLPLPSRRRCAEEVAQAECNEHPVRDKALVRRAG